MLHGCKSNSTGIPAGCQFFMNSHECGSTSQPYAAIEDGDVDTSRDLLQQLPPNLIDTIGPEGDTLLHLACLYSHEECVKLLLEYNASVHVRDEDNSCVLHDSSAGGCDSQSLCPAATSDPCPSCTVVRTSPWARQLLLGHRGVLQGYLHAGTSTSSAC
jgi:ankyrin repeat protein